jgi:hypothetical protein
MDAAFQLFRQGGMDSALALNPGDAVKGRRHQPDMEVGFALGAVIAGCAGMAGMAGAFVYHLQRKRGKSGGQFVMNGIGDAHGRTLF